MTHVHARLSALVDGELDHESRDRVLAHLAHCSDCRAAAEAERQVKALLGSMTRPAPTDQLRSSLVHLAETGQLDPALDHRAGVVRRPYLRGRTRVLSALRPAVAFPVPRRVGGPGSRRPASGRPGGRRPDLVGGQHGRLQRRVAAGVVGAAAMAGMAVVAAFAAGGSAGDVRVVPPVQRFSVEHAGTVSNLPLSDPGAVTAVLDRGLLDHPNGR